MAKYNPSVGKTANVGALGGVHSFAVSFLKTAKGNVKSSDFDLPFFYIAPLTEGSVTVLPLNSNEEVTLPAEFVKMNVGCFIPVQVREVKSDNNVIIGL